MIDLLRYRESHTEKTRTESLLKLIKTCSDCFSFLDVGARDGYFSQLLTDTFSNVTALDLHKPKFRNESIDIVQGDVTRLPFLENSFDVVLCSEVLEHIPTKFLDSACNELMRVFKKRLIIGVPFLQDLRIARTTCAVCGGLNPAWGHINSFSERRLLYLFNRLKPCEIEFIGLNNLATNPLSTFLLDIAGNPFGTYEQEESCIFCGKNLIAPPSLSPQKKVCAYLGLGLNKIQRIFHTPHPNWIHIAFQK